MVNHKRGNVSVAVQIGEEMVKVASSDIFFRNCAISIILSQSDIALKKQRNQLSNSVVVD